MQSSSPKFNVLIRWLMPGIVILFSAMYLWRSFLSENSPRADFSMFRTRQEWVEYPGNPVLPDKAHSQDTGAVFHLGLWQENVTSTGVPSDLYFRNPDVEPVGTAMMWRMWSSWQSSHGIAYSTSEDGKTWDQNLQISLGSGDTQWEHRVSRPFVKKVAVGQYAMWYTGQETEAGIGGSIGYAESTDGITFKRVEAEPVLLPTLPWELETVMTPTVVDLPNGVLRMYYAAGDAYEPDAIGAAHSYDGGFTWIKHGNPIFEPDQTSGKVGVWWDSYKVTSPHVIHGDDEYFYMFYTGFRNLDHSSIGLARSRDGLTGWERHVGNPIVDIRDEAWNCDSVYNPFGAWSEAQQEWLLWYNGRCGPSEWIGLSTLQAKSFSGFVKRD